MALDPEACAEYMRKALVLVQALNGDAWKAKCREMDKDEEQDNVKT